MKELVEEWKIWKDTSCYNGGNLWEVSNFGNVRQDGIEYTPKVHDSRGYLDICGVFLHRIVAELFIPKTEEDIALGRNVIDHIDTNKLNNRVDNLRWCTPRENALNPLTQQHVLDSRDKSAHTWSLKSEEELEDIRNRRTENWKKWYYSLSDSDKELLGQKYSESQKGKPKSDSARENIRTANAKEENKQTKYFKEICPYCNKEFCHNAIKMHIRAKHEK